MSIKDFKLNIFNNSSSGVFLSGGLDSAILAALILEKVQYYKMNITLTFLTVDKTNSIQFVNNILVELKKKYTHPFKTQFNIDNTGSKPGAITEAIRLQLANFDFIYTGVNQNPPLDIVKLSGLYPKRPTENIHKNLILPFMNLHKTDILELAIINNLTWLIPLTHSCTESFEGKCNTCFACSERAWAFEKLGLKDKN